MGVKFADKISSNSDVEMKCVKKKPGAIFLRNTF